MEFGGKGLGFRFLRFRIWGLGCRFYRSVHVALEPHHGTRGVPDKHQKPRIRPLRNICAGTAVLAVVLLRRPHLQNSTSVRSQQLSRRAKKNTTQSASTHNTVAFRHVHSTPAACLHSQTHETALQNKTASGGRETP